MMERLTKTFVATTLLLSAFAPRLDAQTGATNASSSSTITGPTAGAAARVVIDRARALAEAGKGAEAKTLLDSLVNASMNEPGDLADALYWRAVLGERAADAERDWKRMVMDVPLSPRVPTALLRLGELEMVRGHPAGARSYLERLLRDYNSAEERPKALLWVVRSYFDERDVARACRTLIALRETDVPDGELRLQANELQARCRNEAAKVGSVATAGANDAKTGERAAANDSGKKQAAAPKTADKKSDGKSGEKSDTNAGVKGDANKGAKTELDSAVKVDIPLVPTREGKTAAKSESKAGAVRYGVQIAAYDTREQANVVVKRMTKRGLSAHVDGDAKPYRVRIGRYETRKEAEAALARLKKQGQKGFVTVLTP